jgi:Response regulator receiver domain
VCVGLKWGKADQVIKPPPQRLTIALSCSRCPRRTSNMPGMDGLQLLGEIKQRFPDLPVMMVTAYGDDARRRQATEYGADKCGSCPARHSRNKHMQDARCSGSQPRIARSSPEPPQAAYPSHSIGDGIRVRTVAPKLGQHNAEVFGRIGVTGLEIKARPEKRVL